MKDLINRTKRPIRQTLTFPKIRIRPQSGPTTERVKKPRAAVLAHKLQQSEGITRWCCLMSAEPDFGNGYSTQVSQERAVVIHDIFGCAQSLA